MYHNKYRTMIQFNRFAALLSIFVVTTVRFSVEGNRVLVEQNNYNNDNFLSATAEIRRRHLEEQEENDSVKDEIDNKEEEKEIGSVVEDVVEDNTNKDGETNTDDEDDEGYDWKNDEEDEDDIEVVDKNNSSNNSNNKEEEEEEESASSPYKGTVPENFDFGYTYKYEDLTEYDPWPIGTLTLLEFQDGYYEGIITSFELSEDDTVATYVVTWSDDTTDTFVNELEWMDLMVDNAEKYEPWEVGTYVLSVVYMGWYLIHSFIRLLFNLLFQWCFSSLTSAHSSSSTFFRFAQTNLWISKSRRWKYRTVPSRRNYLVRKWRI